MWIFDSSKPTDRVKGVCVFRRAGSCHARNRSSHIHKHGVSYCASGSLQSTPSPLCHSCYLAFSGLGRTAPHETLINNLQVLLPVVHFKAVDMRAARGTHGSHSIRFLRPLGGETCANPSTQTRSKRAGCGWLACQVRSSPIAAHRLTGHVVVAVTCINFLSILHHWTWLPFI